MNFTVAGVKISLGTNIAANEKSKDLSGKFYYGGTTGLNLQVTDLIDDLLDKTAPKDKLSIPDGLLPDLVLKDLFASYNGKSKEVNIVALASISKYEVKFFFHKAKATGKYAFGIQADISDLKGLPMVGSQMKDVRLANVGFVYCSKDGKFNIPKISDASDSDPSIARRIMPDGISSEFTKGFNLAGDLFLPFDKDPFSLVLPVVAKQSTENNNTNNLKALPKEASAPLKPAEKWFKLGKSIGPLSVSALGFSYKENDLSLLFRGDVSLAGLTVSLEGLGLSFNLSELLNGEVKTPRPFLNGLGLDFDKGDIDIGGAFLKVVEGDITNYFGEAIVQFGNYGLTAIGGYAPAQGKGKDHHPASFFIYGNLEGPLGGPPFLYVTGLAFGFGSNYSLNMPTINTLGDCLLLPNNAPKQATSPSKTMATILPKLTESRKPQKHLPLITNEPGEDWLAAGVQFTSFNMVSAFALVTVSFGVETEIGILGSCAVTLPKGDQEPLAYVDIDLVSSFKPSGDVLPVYGVVAPSSYILSSNIKLQGGFAFCVWYSGEHNGDFVFTVGGYYPGFNKPSYYPTAPRISINFSSGPFHASGTAYMALTPGMFMAGLSYSATWSYANISAWYHAGADFLINWAPFTYRADAYVSVGCSVRLALFTVHASVGADAVIWGPSFGGRVHVDLDVVSFTIGFGSSHITPTPVSWKDINTKFLQSGVSSHQHGIHDIESLGASEGDAASGSSTNVAVSVSKGLRKTNVTSPGGTKYDWVLDPNHFTIVTATKIPANRAKWITGSSSSDFTPISNTLPLQADQSPQLQLGSDTQTFSDTQIWNTDLYVRPMNLSGVKSHHTIQLTRADDKGFFTNYITDVAIEPVTLHSNAALWGDPGKNKDANTQLVKATLAGFKIIAKHRNPSRVNDIALIELLFAPGNYVYFSWTSAQPDTDYTVTSAVSKGDLKITIGGESTESFTDENYVLSSLTDTWVIGQRNTILDDLVNNGFSTYPASEVNPTKMGSEKQLMNWPLVEILGT